MTHENDPRSPDAGPSRRRTGRVPVPQTAAEWRELLAREELPPEVDELRGRRRRKAKRRWRSARRDARTEWIRDERKKVPTPTVIPVIALLVAAAVAAAAWLWPDHNGAGTTKPTTTPTVEAPEAAPSTSPTPTESAPAATNNPTAVAKAFVTAYTTRRPLQDGSHKAAVQRAAPYASTPLVENLERHDDRDFNELVAAQATEAMPTKVDIGQPSVKDRPAPDTSVRVYLQADVTLDVKATDPYSYTRHLTIEVARADAASRWMVTRVLGLEE
ncbi:hypothetical protein [Streptomyces mutabilis]|uniref:hypothetical protein n=1 Tax=Streptomyces mutabilis TaxID=67332 RepID=UPI000A712D55|nr:hypothetical protein [Streptomyces mutabilis]